MLVQCNQCSKSYKVQESAIGKRVKCKCGFSFVVESATQTERDDRTSSTTPLSAFSRNQSSQKPPSPESASLPSSKPVAQIGKPTVGMEGESVSLTQDWFDSRVEINPVISTCQSISDAGNATQSVSVLRARREQSIHPLILWGGGGTTVLLIVIFVVLMNPGVDKKQQARRRENSSIQAAKKDQANQLVKSDDKKQSKISDQPSGITKPAEDRNSNENASKNDELSSGDGFHDLNQPANQEQAVREPPLFTANLKVEVSLPEWVLPADLSPVEAIEKFATTSGKEREQYEEVLIRAGAEAVPDLMEKVKQSDADPGSRFSIFPLCQVLSKIGKPAIDPLLKLAEDNSLKEETRSNAIRAIGDMGPTAAPAVRRLAQIYFGRKEAGIRDIKLAAANALGNIGMMTEQVQQVLNEILLNEGGQFHNNYVTVALRAVKNIGADAGPLVPTIRKYLWTQTNQAQEAAEALGAIGAPAGSSAVDFVQLLKNNDTIVTYRTYHALRDIGPTAIAAVPALIKKLQNSNNDFERANIAEALGRMGPAAAGALTILGKYLAEAEREEFDQAQRIVYRLAIDRIKGNPLASIPYMRNALTDNAHNARVEAAKQIGNLGPAGKVLVPDLASVILNVETKHSVVDLAIRSLGRLGSDGADGLGTLITFINREHENAKGQKTYRMHAMDAIASINSDARVLRGLQRIASHDPDSNAREKARRLIQRLQAKSMD